MKELLLPVAAFVAMIVSANSLLAETRITEIQVSPNVINLASASTVVTVHTDLPYSSVDGEFVTLNTPNETVCIDWWKQDDRGNFVAKFDSDEVKALDEVKDAGEDGVYVTLTLEGKLTTGEPFVGTDEVKVISVQGKGR